MAIAKLPDLFTKKGKLIFVSIVELINHFLNH